MSISLPFVLDLADIRRVALPAKPAGSFAAPVYIGDIEPGYYKLTGDRAFRVVKGKSAIVNSSNLRIDAPADALDPFEINNDGISLVSDTSIATEVWLVRYKRGCLEG